MKINNLGNIKLISLLFLLGSASAVLLIPAVIQKESYVSDEGMIKGNSIKTEDPIIQTVETIKKEYIEVPVNKVVETTKEIRTYIENPAKIVYQEVQVSSPNQNLITQATGITNPLNFILGDSTNNLTQASPSINTKPEALIKITQEMVDNCKIITSEFNKVSK